MSTISGTAATLRSTFRVLARHPRRALPPLASIAIMLLLTGWPILPLLERAIGPALTPASRALLRHAAVSSTLGFLPHALRDFVHPGIAVAAWRFAIAGRRDVVPADPTFADQVFQVPATRAEVAGARA